MKEIETIFFPVCENVDFDRLDNLGRQPNDFEKELIAAMKIDPRSTVKIAIMLKSTYDKLDSDDKTILEMRYEGKTDAEIAKAMKICKRTVMRRRKTATEKLFLVKEKMKQIIKC